MTIHVKKVAALAMSTSLLPLAAPAQAKVEVAPYLEVDQVVAADLKNGGDVLTYTTLAAGIDAQVQNSRSEAQLAYRYEHRFGWGKQLDDSDIHSGLLRGSHQLVPGLLTIEGGALATRARTDIRGSDLPFEAGNTDNVSQVYSVYAGPTLATKVGDLNVGAAYRVGYTRAENKVKFTQPQPRQIDGFDDSVSHLLTGSVGMESGVLPFGWTVSGAYERENIGQLKGRFEDAYIRGDVVVPITPTLAAVGGVGYEHTQISTKSPLLDANGAPVYNSKGRQVTDPASPRLLAYENDGLYWDVGVAWKPSKRTGLEARVGRRYGNMSYTGSFNWQMDQFSAMDVSVYDQVQTFGQSVNDNLSRVPVRFLNRFNPLVGAFNGCSFGTGGQSGGGCLGSSFQSINSSAFRARGVNIAWSRSHGPWTYGLGGGYANRKYLTPGGIGFALRGVEDQSWFGSALVGYEINPQSSVDAQIYANYYDSGFAGAPSVLSTGVTTSYQRRFGRRLSGTAALGLYSSKADREEGDLLGSALVGMRYTF